MGSSGSEPYATLPRERERPASQPDHENRLTEDYTNIVVLEHPTWRVFN